MNDFVLFWLGGGLLGSLLNRWLFSEFDNNGFFCLSPAKYLLYLFAIILGPPWLASNAIAFLVVSVENGNFSGWFFRPICGRKK